MGISSRIETLDRDIAFILSEDLSPEAQSHALARFARREIHAAQDQNAAAMGLRPDYEVTVDGRRHAPIEDVRPDGTVVAEFDLLLDLFTWIGAQLVINSPRLSGRYAESHVFFVDGNETQLSGIVPAGSEYAFVNVQPYARKIERGLSSQAPDGVYQAVAAVAARRFGNVARIRFSYRSLTGGKADRAPAIVITLGR
jgi:hypothetical protein